MTDSPAHHAAYALKLARSYLVEAAGLLAEADREDSALLTEKCDWLEQYVREVQSAVEVRRP